MTTPSPYSARPWLKHYDYWVRPPLTYPTRPLHEILAATAAEIPAAPATAFLGATLTFAEVKRRTDRLSAALLELGIAKGDRVGIMLPNCPQYVIAAFATLRLGAIVVNINPTYTSRELLGVAADSGIRILITLDRLAPLAAGIRDATRIETIVVTSVEDTPPRRPRRPSSPVRSR